MLDEELKKSKKSPLTSMDDLPKMMPSMTLSSSNNSNSSNSFNTNNEYNNILNKQRTPTRPPMLIKKGSTPVSGDSFFSHSMPVRPIIGSLPVSSTILAGMPTLNLPPSTSVSNNSQISKLIKSSPLKDDQGENFMPRSLLKHDEGVHMPIKKSFAYAASCPSNIANFPKDIVEKMAFGDLDVGEEDEPMISGSVTAFSILEVFD